MEVGFKGEEIEKNLGMKVKKELKKGKMLLIGMLVGDEILGSIEDKYGRSRILIINVE